MAVSQPLVTTIQILLPIPTTTGAVTAAITLVLTTPVVVTITAAPPVVSAVPVTATPQGGIVSSTQQPVPSVVEVTETVTVVTASGGSIPSQASTAGTFSVISAVSEMFPPASQSQLVSGTFITPSGNTHPVSHPIVIQPYNQRPASGVILGVEGLTLPSDPAATMVAMMVRLVDPIGSQTSLQGLASHQAVGVTSQEGATTAATVIGTIHGPGLPRPITVAGGSTEPIVSASTSQGEGSQVFMVVEDDDDIVEIGSAQGFTQLVEPMKEKTDPPSTMPHTSIGRGVEGGASQGGPP